MEKNGTLQKGQGSYHCNICKDVGYILKEVAPFRFVSQGKCKCTLLKEARERMERSGLGDLLETKTFDNYQVETPYQKTILSTAKEYVSEFLKGNRWSFGVIGQSGVGKTHISAAISKKLLDEGVGVKYFIADEISQNLQACKYDEENYNNEFNRIVGAEVLFIDDLFKSSITNYYQKESIKQDDLKEIFKVINYRYNKKLPILLNSEIHFERFVEIDQAIIGRINEMCNYKYLLSIKPDSKKNFRLNMTSI